LATLQSLVVDKCQRFRFMEREPLSSENLLLTQLKKLDKSRRLQITLIIRTQHQLPRITETITITVIVISIRTVPKIILSWKL